MQEDPTVQPLSPEETVRARIARARMLSVLWCLVSPGALFLILHEASWRSAATPIEAAKAVRLEQWVGFGLLAAHVWFLLQARLWTRTVRAAR